jgi:hypothetical protein
MRLPALRGPINPFSLEPATLQEAHGPAYYLEKIDLRGIKLNQALLTMQIFKTDFDEHFTR